MESSMEIVAGILIIASVVLPALLILAMVAFVGFASHSWFTELRTKPASGEATVEPEAGSVESPVAEPARNVPAPA
jgi:hypothetical protein